MITYSQMFFTVKADSAVNAKENDQAHLNLMERQRTKVWLRKAYTVIGALLESD